MAPSVKHKKIATVPDHADYEVGSSEWNDEHELIGVETEGTAATLVAEEAAARQTAINALGRTALVDKDLTGLSSWTTGNLETLLGRALSAAEEFICYLDGVPSISALPLLQYNSDTSLSYSGAGGNTTVISTTANALRNPGPCSQSYSARITMRRNSASGFIATSGIISGYSSDTVGACAPFSTTWRKNESIVTMTVSLSAGTWVSGARLQIFVKGIGL